MGAHVLHAGLRYILTRRRLVGSKTFGCFFGALPLLRVEVDFGAGAELDLPFAMLSPLD